MHPPADANGGERTRESARVWARRWRLRLLYGENVDPARKTRARIGLVMLVFAALFCIIGGRLVLFAVSPDGAEVSQVIGHVNIDNQGLAGIEKWLDGRGLADLHLAGLATERLQTPVELALDLRVQHALRDELIAAREKYKAIAAAGLL